MGATTMDPKSAVAELEELARKLDVTVSYDRIAGEGAGPGGLCKVKGAWRVIVDRRAGPVERAAILARALSRFDTEAHFLSPGVRALLDRYRPGDGGPSPAEGEAAPAADPAPAGDAPPAEEPVPPGEAAPAGG